MDVKTTEYLNATAAAEYCKKQGQNVSPSAIRAARLSGALVPACAVVDSSGKAVSFGFDLEGIKHWLKNRRLGRPPKKKG